MQDIDLTNCDKEPIHLINKIQRHGATVIVNPETRTCIGHSHNIHDFIPDFQKNHRKQKLIHFIPENICEEIFSVPTKSPSFRELRIQDKNRIAIFHHNGEEIILELEPKDEQANIVEQQVQLSRIFSVLNKASDIEDMCHKAAKLIKGFTGYDRVMIYRFDEHWNGSVIAESCEDHLESWLGLKYPASDIPKQARALFLQQGVRIVSDVNSEAVDVFLQKSKEVDFSNSELRAVSSIHIEYLKNMKVGATLTAAIVYNDELWGLVACHHYQSRFIDYYTRSSVKFLTQVFSTQLGLRSTNQNLLKTNRSNEIRARLLEKLSSNWNILKGLQDNRNDFMELTEGTGVAIYFDKNLVLAGESPSQEEVIKLLHRITSTTDDDIFATDNIQDRLQMSGLSNQVAGVLCVFLSSERRDALLWFKSEITKSVTWAGNPEKSVVDENGTLTPRKSFAKWQQLKSGFSHPWKMYEIASAKAMREHISEIVLHKYEEIVELNQRLKEANKELESFSYSVSHDLRAPLRGISGFSQILSEKYFDVLDDFGKDALAIIGRSTKKMNTLIDDILSFSGLGKKATEMSVFDMNELVADVLEYLNVDEQHPDTQIRVHNSLGAVKGDRAMLFQLQNNLISNAIKYSAHSAQPEVIIGVENDTFFVKDNGIGFDMKHASQIFGVFKRLVSDTYEGSGIGLAIAQRVIEKHNGKIWVESIPNSGSTFYFTLKAD